MKPVSVRFQCFGPYLGEQFIDFQQLEANGLFLICGETGAGKTTILDAICYALYGKSSGGLRGDMKDMRCKSAGKEDETLVEFIFDANGRRYKFIRTLRYGRKQLIDEHNCMVLEDGAWVPFFENPKQRNVNQKAQELIGLTDEQFRQVIILPQGKFETLLVADSVKKEEILVSLFHADRWQRMADEVYRRVDQRDKALKEVQSQIRAKLGEYRCADLEEMTRLAQQWRESAAALEAAGREAAGAENAQRQRYEAALVSDGDFRELSLRKKKLEGLLAVREAQEEQERLLGLADIADTIAPRYDASAASAQGLREAEKAAAAGAKACEAARRELEAVIARKARHDGAAAQNEENKGKITLLENARGLYNALAQGKLAVARTEAAVQAAAREKTRAEANFQALDERWLACMEAQKEAFAAYTQAQEAYLRNIGGILARELRPGCPCRVCGSVVHPSPAVLEESAVTDQDVERKNKVVTAAGKAVTQAAEARTKGEEEKNRAAAALAQAEQKAAAAASEYAVLVKNQLPGIGDARQLEETAARLKKAVSAFEAEALRLSAELTAAHGRETVTAAAAAQAEERHGLAAAQAEEEARRWEEALSASGLGTEEAFLAARLEPGEKDRRKGECLRFRASLTAAREAYEQQREKLADQTQPDMALLRAGLDQTLAARKKTERELILKQQALSQLEGDLASLTRRKAEHDAARIQVDEDLDFANRLRGRSGLSLAAVCPWCYVNFCHSGGQPPPGGSPWRAVSALPHR